MRLPASSRSLPVDAARACLLALGEAGLTVSIAESCTGGLVAAALTAIPGSSDRLWGGFVVYSNEAKTRCLGVREETLETHGAVSGETVAELLDGLSRITGAGCGIAISGIAGPGGGSAEKPVGTVWVGIRVPGAPDEIQRLRLGGGRDAVRKAAATYALESLARRLDRAGAIAKERRAPYS